MWVNTLRTVSITYSKKSSKLYKKNIILKWNMYMCIVVKYFAQSRFLSNSIYIVLIMLRFFYCY